MGEAQGGPGQGPAPSSQAEQLLDVARAAPAAAPGCAQVVMAMGTLRVQLCQLQLCLGSTEEHCQNDPGPGKGRDKYPDGSLSTQAL